jgi:hypothetical protein
MRPRTTPGRTTSSTCASSGSNIAAPNISLLAEATEPPLPIGALTTALLQNPVSEVTVDGATLTANGGTVTLSAQSKIDMTGAKAENGTTFFDNGLAGTVITSFPRATANVLGNTTISAANLNTTATVDVDIEAIVQDATVKILTVWAAGDARVNIGDDNGTTTINVTGDVQNEAKSDVKIDAKAEPVAGGNTSSADAAVVNVNVIDVDLPVVVPEGFNSGADMTVGGGAAITAGNTAAFKATTLIDVSNTADGDKADTVGATVAVTTVESDTTAVLTDNAAVNAPTVDLTAATTRTIATTAKSTPGGPTGAGTSSSTALANNNAATSGGNVTIAGAVTVNHVGGTTKARIDSAAPTAVTATTALNVGATSTDTVSSVADASGTDAVATGGFGLAIGVALSFVDISVDASLGTTSLNAAAVNVTATEDGDNTFTASATSGAGSKNVGLAGTLSINDVETSVRAFVENGATVNLNNNALNVTATSGTKSVSSAKPLDDGATGESFGFGASVAMNLANNLTQATLESGATITNGTAVKFAANADHKFETSAKMGADAGTAITPVVALTFADNITRTVFDTLSTVTASGNIDGEATQVVDVITKGDGDAEGSKSLAAGGTFGYTSLNDVVEARADGTLTSTGGNVGLRARNRTKSKTDSTANAAGATDQGQTVNQQAQAQKTAAQNQGGQGSSQPTPSAETVDGPIAVAAAMSYSVVDANVSATVSGTISAANGTVTVSSLAHQDDLAAADGSATGAGSLGIGAAVALSRADHVNMAQVKDGATITADGITVETGVTDNQVGLTANEPITVDVDADAETIFVGENTGLTTGAPVVYSNGGAADIGGLSDGTTYFVIDAGGGKIKLATTEANAQAGTAIDLGSPLDQGDAHTLTRADVTFDPQSIVDDGAGTIFLGEDTGLTTGAPVVYSNGGGTDIGGLSDGMTYFVIDDGGGKFKLAMTEQDADNDVAIPLTGPGRAQRTSSPAPTLPLPLRP